MFGKHSNKMETIIGADSEFKGELKVKGTLRVDGSMEGGIQADWVIVGESGKIKGSIESRGTIVGGSIEGTIHANEILELKSASCVKGEIHSARLAITEGAVFSGQSIPVGENNPAEAQDGRVVKLNSPTAS
jgi:cytoskeletal protein CcmA (bactofilin family)